MNLSRLPPTTARCARWRRASRTSYFAAPGAATRHSIRGQFRFARLKAAGAQIYYVVRRILAPTMGDYELIPLPRPLFPLYWVIRPFRMAAQYGPRLLRKH